MAERQRAGIKTEPKLMTVRFSRMRALVITQNAISMTKGQAEARPYLATNTHGSSAVIWIECFCRNSSASSRAAIVSK